MKYQIELRKSQSFPYINMSLMFDFFQDPPSIFVLSLSLRYYRTPLCQKVYIIGTHLLLKWHSVSRDVVENVSFSYDFYRKTAPFSPKIHLITKADFRIRRGSLDVSTEKNSKTLHFEISMKYRVFK